MWISVVICCGFKNLMSNLIFCLLGSTASGKTELALSLVEQFNFEIISVDSAVIYREMNIGTAKPSDAILNTIPHHLVNIINPDETYSVARFLEDVDISIKEIQAKGKIPLLVGGTMMYFNVFNNGLSNLPQKDLHLRQELSDLIHTKGLNYAYAKLLSLDPLAKRINQNDTQRIIRALEVCLLTNKPYSSFLQERKSSIYTPINLMLVPFERSFLHDKIALRFKEMLHLGLVDEVKMLIEKYHLDLTFASMRSVGYRQVLMYLFNQLDRDAMEYKAIVATRQLAKRQLTWLRSHNFAQNYKFICENPNLAREVMEQVKEILDNTDT